MTDHFTAAVASPRSRLSIIAVVVCVAVLLAVLVVISTVVYENESEGAASLIGFAVSQLLVWSLLLLVLKKKFDAGYRFAIACLLTSAYMLFDKREEIPFALDTKQSQIILADAKGIDPVKLFAQHPDNRMLRAMADTYKAAQASQAKFDSLGNAMEPPVLGEDIRNDAPRTKLVAYRDGARTAASNARSALNDVDAINREESETLQKQVSAYAPEGTVRSLLRGVARRHERDSRLLKEVLLARAGLYEGLEGSVAHLIDNYGQYTVDKNNKVLYQSNDVVTRHNELSKVQAAAVERLRSAVKEIEKAQNQYQQSLARFSSGDIR